MTATNHAAERPSASKRQLRPGVVQRDTHIEHLVWPYLIAVPILFLIGAYVQIKGLLYGLFGTHPHTNFWLVDGVSINSRRVKDGAARWPALDACYNFTGGEGAGPVSRAIDAYWLHIRNAQAVRNRLKIAKHELRKVIESLGSANGTPVRVLSLAAGTAQGVLEVVAELRHDRGIDAEVLLIDMDESALEYAQKLAIGYGVEDRVAIRKGNVLFFNRELKGFQPDVIEMMGLIDYLRDSTIIPLIQKIGKYLRCGGYFFTCHIHLNAEAYFLKHVVNWDMTYRSRDQLHALVEQGGFPSPQLYTEPHGIHTIAIARQGQEFRTDML